MAQILEIKRTKHPKPTERESWVMGVLALLSRCRCEECIRYREIAVTDPDAALRQL